MSISVRPVMCVSDGGRGCSYRGRRWNGKALSHLLRMMGKYIIVVRCQSLIQEQEILLK